MVSDVLVMLLLIAAILALNELVSIARLPSIEQSLAVLKRITEQIAAFIVRLWR